MLTRVSGGYIRYIRPGMHIMCILNVGWGRGLVCVLRTHYDAVSLLKLSNLGAAKKINNEAL